MQLNNHLMRAFRIAHHAGENAEMTTAAREKFRAIAHEIWQAYGRPDDSELDPAAAPDGGAQ